MVLPLPQKLTHAIKYLRTLLSSKNPEDWRLRKRKISGSEATNLPIAQRWRDIFVSEWRDLPDKPSPLEVSISSRQPNITDALRNIPPPTSQPTYAGDTRIVLHFKSRRKKGSKRDPASKRKPVPIIEPLRGSDALGGNASILSVLARAEPRKIKHNRRFTCVEEFLVH
jgi:hypothetical protein